MTLPRSVAEILREQVTLELECIDRMYLNVYVPALQTEKAVAAFFKFHRGHLVASSALMEPISKAFVAGIERFAQEHNVPMVAFSKGERKDEVAAQQLKKFCKPEGVVFIGRAQEKTPVFRTERRRNPKTGRPYPWLVRSTAIVNHFYFYCVDEDFGPFFLKFATYFPYSAKLCINGNEYLKRQLSKARIAYEPLDNGVRACAEPRRAQAICDKLSAQKIDELLRKWLRRLPHPFTAKDRAAGYRYELSIIQAEFSLTQVLKRPVDGRVFFEEVIRENLDIGRPAQVQLIFERRVMKNTPGRFRTRVITEGVTPSLYINYKSSRIKQYHKEGCALRTETTINNTHDFYIGRRIKNLPALRQLGFQANRRLLEVQRISHDCTIGEKAFNRVQRPIEVQGQRASAMRFADPRVLALFSALVLFRLLPRGFSNHELKKHLAPLQHLQPEQLTSGRMTYDLRRLRLHGLIERIPKSHRYRVTTFGLRTALFFTRTYARIIRPGLSMLIPQEAPSRCALRSSFEALENAIDNWCQRAKLAA
jgi:hypothetical protein